MAVSTLRAGLLIRAATEGTMIEGVVHSATPRADGSTRLQIAPFDHPASVRVVNLSPDATVQVLAGYYFRPHLETEEVSFSGGEMMVSARAISHQHYRMRIMVNGKDKTGIPRYASGTIAQVERSAVLFLADWATVQVYGLEEMAARVWLTPAGKPLRDLPQGSEMKDGRIDRLALTAGIRRIVRGQS